MAVRFGGIRGRCDFCSGVFPRLFDLDVLEEPRNAAELKVWCAASFLNAQSRYCAKQAEYLVEYSAGEGVEAIQRALAEAAAWELPSNHEPDAFCLVETPDPENIFLEAWPQLAAGLDPGKRRCLVRELVRHAAGWEEGDAFAGQAFASRDEFSARPWIDWDEFGRLVSRGRSLPQKDANRVRWARKALASLQAVWQAGKRLYRARVGFRERIPRDAHDAFAMPAAPIPALLMGAPPPEKVSAGRINRCGQPVLYLATDVPTAVSEVRPWKGALVTVAKFRLRDEKMLLDLTALNSRLSPLSMPLFEIVALRHLIGNIPSRFAVPVNPSSVREESYASTQAVAETIKEVGYDGIIYPSALGPGKNVVFFDTNVAEAEHGEVALHRVDKVTYVTSARPRHALAVGQEPIALPPLGARHRHNRRRRTARPHRR